MHFRYATWGVVECVLLVCVLYVYCWCVLYVYLHVCCCCCCMCVHIPFVLYSTCTTTHAHNTSTNNNTYPPAHRWMVMMHSVQHMHQAPLAILCMVVTPRHCCPCAVVKMYHATKVKVDPTCQVCVYSILCCVCVILGCVLLCLYMYPVYMYLCILLCMHIHCACIQSNILDVHHPPPLTTPPSHTHPHCATDEKPMCLFTDDDLDECTLTPPILDAICNTTSLPACPRFVALQTAYTQAQKLWTQQRSRTLLEANTMVFNAFIFMQVL